LHERAGVAFESMFANQLEEHLDELAHHYSRSNDVAKAVEYLGRAGQQALQRSAYTDGLRSLSAALNLLQRLPDSFGRVRRELQLQLAVGSASIGLKGYAAQEVERTYIRARELCELLDDPTELFPALFGLWAMHLVRGELRQAYELAEQLLWRAQGAHDPMLLIYAHLAWGAPSYWMGKFLPVREHLESAIALYDPERHRPIIFSFNGLDAGVVCLQHVAWALWQLGYPDQALKRGDEALALARKLSNPFNLAFTEFFIGVLRQLRREARTAQEHAESGIALSADHGFIELLADATTLRGWAMAKQGHNEQGIA
jgi:tetratricopeptide (TPR) repeat protein